MTAGPHRSLQGSSPRQALLTLRIVWGSLLFGELLFLYVAGMGVVNPAAPRPPRDPAVLRTLLIASWATLLLCIPLGYFVRNQIYKRSWRGPAVTPGGYFAGNVVLLSLCVVVVQLAVVSSILHASFWPAALPGGGALVVQLLNFPHGRPMFADNPSSPPPNP